MKKTFVLMAVLSVAAVSGFAQTVNTAVGRTTFGIRAGVNFQNLNGKDADGDNLENKLTTGFNVGVNAEIPIAPEFYLQPGVLFTTKGAKFDDDADSKVGLSYVEVPINLLYKPVLGTGNLLLGFGPYAAFGIGGKFKSDAGDSDIEFENEISPAQAISGMYYRRFDAGANILVGYEFSSKISAQLNAQLGLLNIYPEISGVDTDTRVKNTGFGLSVGYRF